MSNVNAAAVAVETIQNVSSLVEMNQHKWGTEKTDNQTTAEVKQQKKASGKAGKYRTNLANGFERDLQTLTRIMSRAYHTHMRMTMPWGDGMRLLANTALIEYLGAMQGFKAELDTAKAKLIPELPTAIERAVKLNGDLGKAEDYPSPVDIVGAYSFDFDFTPVPDSAGFAGLPDGFRETFEDKYTSRVQDRMAAGVQDILTRIQFEVNAFHLTLGKDKPKFFQTTLDKLAQLNATLTGANMSGDTDLLTITSAISSITQYDIKQVKGNATIQQAVRSSVEGLVPALAHMIGSGLDTTPAAPPTPEPVQETVVPSEGTPPATQEPEPSPEPVQEEEPLLGSLEQFLIDPEPETPSTTVSTVEKPKSLIDIVADMPEEELVPVSVDEQFDEVFGDLMQPAPEPAAPAPQPVEPSPSADDDNDDLTSWINNL